jgi:riboflavin synthase
MFTGIIETTGTIKEIAEKGKNRSFSIETSLGAELKVDQSVSHNGICLTVEELTGSMHRVTAINETLQKTNAGNWKVGDSVNIERCLKIVGRLDGHLVQGHVDTTGICKKRADKDGSWVFEFEFDKKFAALVIEKGSICVNGISLTAFNVKKKRFSVAIIPFTFEHTTIQYVCEGDAVNIEFDLLGKYILRKLSLKD